jgi:hypothetical protein
MHKIMKDYLNSLQHFPPDLVKLRNKKQNTNKASVIRMCILVIKDRHTSRLRVDKLSEASLRFHLNYRLILRHVIETSTGRIKSTSRSMLKFAWVSRHTCQLSSTVFKEKKSVWYLNMSMMWEVNFLSLLSFCNIVRVSLKRRSSYWKVRATSSSLFPTNMTRYGSWEDIPDMSWLCRIGRRTLTGKMERKFQLHNMLMRYGHICQD